MPLGQSKFNECCCRWDQASVGVLEDHLHAPAQRPAGAAAMLPQRRAGEDHRPLGGLEQADQEPAERALAAAALADHAHGLALGDPHRRIEAGEQRWQTLGQIHGVTILLVIHTMTEEGPVEVIRIISARKATRSERKRYEEQDR